MELQKLTKKDGFYKQQAFVIKIDGQIAGLITKFNDTKTRFNPWQAKRYTGQNSDGCHEFDLIGSFWKDGKTHRIGDKKAALEAVLNA